VRKRATAASCADCPEEGPVCVGGFGPEKARLVIVGEAPGHDECLTGRPFIGKSGQLLNATLQSYGIKRTECFATNSVMCAVKPGTRHHNACWSRLKSEILSREPEIVLTLGKAAFSAVCRTRTPLSKTDGTLWWQPDFGVYVMPTWHPAAVLRGGADDKFFPMISNAIWRISRLLDGRDKFPDPNGQPGYKWTFFRTAEGTIRCAKYYLRKADSSPVPYVISVDTESRSPGKRPHPEQDLWLMLQFYDGDRAAAIDMITNQTPESLRWLMKLIRHPNVEWVGHNIATYDTRVFRHNLGKGVRDSSIRDTLIYGLGLSERANAVGLEPLARTWLGAPAYKRGLAESGYRHAKGPQNELQWKQLAKYGVDDVYNTYELNRILPTLVRDEGTEDLVNNIILPLALTCGKLSGRGFPIDLEQGKRLEELWGGRVDDTVHRLQELAISSGWPKDPNNAKAKDGRLNPRSHLQLAHFALDCLGLAPTDGATNRKYSGTAKNLHGRSRSIDADFLVGHQDTEFGQLMTLLRVYDKQVRTYVRGILKELDPDGLIHPSFDIAGTATGRLVIKPLLQVLPHYGAHAQLEEEDIAKEVRRLFPARKGYVIVTADYKQLEFRVAWMLSGDQKLGHALTSGDMHAKTAAYMFKRDESIVTKADRHAAKRVSFGTAYWRSAYTLAKGPLLEVLGGITIPEGVRIARAQRFIDDFRALYSDYYAWQLESADSAVRNGELSTVFGRKRRWPLITHDNREEIRRQGVNYPIQSTASDMCSSALVRLADVLPKRKLGFPLYTVHDEVVSEIREDRLDEGIAAIAEVMSNPAIDTNGAVFPVDASYGPNLGDLTGYQIKVAA
jgi:uracil-DNA glycosylase family 4